MAVVLQNLYESKGTSFTSALAVSRQSSTSQKADPEFVLKPIAEGLLHNIAQLVVPNGKGKIDDDAATRAAIRAEADAIGESDIEAIMFEARTRENMMFVLDMHLLHSNHNHHGEYALPRAAAATIRARRLSLELDSRDMNAD